MNADNLNRVADAIENHEIAWLGFNMFDLISDYQPDMSGHACDTTACIAGWAFVLEGALDEKALDDAQLTVNPWPAAAKYLGLITDKEFCSNDGEDYQLFCGSPQGVDMESVTPAQAVKTLRYAAKHGVIDWDAAQA